MCRAFRGSKSENGWHDNNDSNNVSAGQHRSSCEPGWASWLSLPPPPLSPHLPGNLFSARLALGSPRSVTFALPQKPVPDRTKYFPLFRFAAVVSAQCSSDTDSPRSSLCLTVSLLLARGCCCCDTPRTSLDLSAASCDASNHGHGGAQRQDQEDVQLEQ